MIALGIDPGTAICGYGIVKLERSRLQALEYGAVFTSPKAQMQDRLLKIHEQIGALIEKYQPDIMGVEQLFFNRNVTTAIPVGQARGVILLSAAEHNLRLVERTPMQIKQAIVGTGSATKAQVIYMVQKILHLPEAPHPDDVADALAIAICATHCASSPIWRNA